MEASAEHDARDPTTYKRRWAILFLYVLYSLLGFASSWLQYYFLRDNLAIFYKVDHYAVDWLTCISIVVYVFFALPTMWLQITKVVYRFFLNV